MSKGSHITLVPSAGPHMIADAAGDRAGPEAAQAALRQAGLTPGQVRKEPSATIAAGIVISTTPAAGAMWPQPEPVRLVVSAGPPMPDFVGQPPGGGPAVGLGQRRLAQRGHRRQERPPAGTVTHQSLSPGSAFTRGQVVTIKISPGPPQVRIPNVDGMQVDQATHVLERLGFSVNVNQIGPLHNVFNYSPNGQAPKGTTITLWVGL